MKFKQRLTRSLGVALCVLALASSSAAENQQQLAKDFTIGRDLRAAGQYSAAIDHLRAVLRRVPGNENVRKELGYALLLDQQYAAAQYHFQILAERASDPQRRALYRAVLNRILSERPFGVSLVLALVPSSNLNFGAKATEVETITGTLPINEESQAQDGWRATFGLRGYARRVLGSRDRLVLNWNVQRTEYSIDAVDASTEVGADLTWQHLTEQGGYALSFGGSQDKSNSERLRRTRVQISGFHLLGTSRRLDWAVSHTDKHYRTNTGRNGADVTANLRHTWFLQGAQSVFVGAVIENSDPNLRQLRYNGRILQLGGRKHFRTGLVLDGVMSLGQRDFGAGGLAAVTRKDTFTEFALSAQDSRIRWQGFTPRATCIVRYNRSNVALFDTVSHECGLHFTRRF